MIKPMIISAILIAACTRATITVHALPATPTPQRVPLSAQQLTKILSGHKIKGEYRFMRERSRTYNFTEFHYANGTTDYAEGPIVGKGKWYPLGSRKICYSYADSTVLNATPSCFWIYEIQGCYYGYNIGSMGVGGRLLRPEDWTARWVIEGDGAACEEPVS